MIVSRGLGRDTGAVGSLVLAGMGRGFIAALVQELKRQARRIYIFRAIEDLFVRARPTEETWIKN